MKTAHLITIGLLIVPVITLGFSAEAKSTSKAAKKSEPIASFGKKRDNHTPIEVTADALEVAQTESQATFSGHVVAIQGDLRLTAEKMIVTYAQKAAAGKNKKSKDENAIQKIEASGKVFLATPEETASGSTAVYDVDEQEIRLNGHVVLTRGKNVLEGENLVYNFATGKSKIVSAAATSAGDKSGKQRVRALFVPEKKDGK